MWGNMDSRRASLLSRPPWLEGESGFCRSAGERSPVSFEEVGMFFTDEEWALLNPGQRMLFWEVTEENYENLASLGSYISQKVLRAPEESILPFLGVHGVVFPRGEGNLWNMEFHRASLLSHSPRLEGEFGSCTSAGKRFAVSFEEVAVFFMEEEWALLDPGQRKIYWEVMKENYESITSLVAGVREMGHEKESGRRVMGKDEDLQVEMKSGDQAVPKQDSRKKWEVKGKQRKVLVGSQRRNKPEVSAQNETWKRNKRHNGPVNHKWFSSKFSVNTSPTITTWLQTYECLECGKSFCWNSALKRHERTHTGEKPYECLECGKCFCYKKSLTEHQMSHTGEKPYKCVECGKCFSKNSALAVHQMVHTGEKPYKCLECGKCFSQNGSLTVHQMVHTGEKRFKCVECGKCFSYNNSLTKHQMVHTGKKPYKCLKCGKCFSLNSYLMEHQKVHTGEKPYKCLECGKCFFRSSSLTKHQKVHTVKKPYKCLECGKCFSHNDSLIGHQKVHTGEKPYKCLECGARFSQNKNLRVHQKVHTGEKPYKCLECGKCFSQNNYLTAHQKVHTGEKPYKCLECGKCFSLKKYLVNHQKVHTGGKLYKCRECGKCFSQNSYLTAHQQVHTGEKPYKCLECGKCFSLKRYLAKHQKVHTGTSSGASGAAGSMKRSCSASTVQEGGLAHPPDHPDPLRNQHSERVRTGGWKCERLSPVRSKKSNSRVWQQ